MTGFGPWRFLWVGIVHDLQTTWTSRGFWLAAFGLPALALLGFGGLVWLQSIVDDAPAGPELVAVVDGAEPQDALAFVVAERSDVTWLTGPIDGPWDVDCRVWVPAVEATRALPLVRCENPIAQGIWTRTMAWRAAHRRAGHEGTAPPTITVVGPGDVALRPQQVSWTTQETDVATPYDGDPVAPEAFDGEAWRMLVTSAGVVVIAFLSLFSAIGTAMPHTHVQTRHHLLLTMGQPGWAAVLRLASSDMIGAVSLMGLWLPAAALVITASSVTVEPSEWGAIAWIALVPMLSMTGMAPVSAVALFAERSLARAPTSVRSMLFTVAVFPATGVGMVALDQLSTYGSVAQWMPGLGPTVWYALAASGRPYSLGPLVVHGALAAAGLWAAGHLIRTDEAPWQTWRRTHANR